MKKGIITEYNEYCLLSKMMGQLAWEKHAVAGGKTEKEAREAFRSRYGISYL